MANTLVFSFGRFNPITIGHEHLVNKIIELAKKNGADSALYFSHSQDAKKNPLPYEDKILLGRKAFGSMVKTSKAKTIIEVLKEIQSKYDNIILVVGSDRVTEIERIVNKYNGKDFTFDSAKVVSAGARDPDAEGVTGMSASKMRAAVAANDIKAFRNGLPKKLVGEYEAIFDLVKTNMKIMEAIEEFNDSEHLNEAVLTVAQRKRRAMQMRRNKARRDTARRRLANRMATLDRLKIRARRKAIRIIRRKVAGKKGEQYNDLSSAERMMIDQRVQKRKNSIERIAKRLLPLVRRDEMKRLQRRNANKRNDAATTSSAPKKDFTQNFESVQAFIEATPNVEYLTEDSFYEAYNTFIQEQITRAAVTDFEKLVDRIFKKYNINFEFTKHFIDRLNDSRNDPMITLNDLAKTIKKIYAKAGRPLTTVKDAEVVIKDFQSDLNIPVVIRYDQKSDEFEVTLKTIMRKKNFKTPDKVVTY